MFTKGAFVNILISDSLQWKTSLRNLEQFQALDHVELWLEHIPQGRELKEVRSAFRNVPLIVHGPFIHTSLVSHIPEIVVATRRRFEEAVDFASTLGARLITFHAGSYPIFEAKDSVLERLARRFEAFSELEDPVATLENMPIQSYGTTREPIGKLSDCEEMVKLLPKVRFTLDVGHCVQNDDDFVPFIRKYKSRIENIHLHDGIVHGKGHLRLGCGNLDLGRFVDVLTTVGFNKSVSLETISADDTRSSWESLCRIERLKGIRDTHAGSTRKSSG